MKALITGGSSDISRAIIKDLSKSYDCFYTASSMTSLEKNKDFFKSEDINTEGFIFDFSSPVLDKNDFDVLILCAASKQKKINSIVDLDINEVKSYISENVNSNVLLIQKCLEHMVKNEFGRIIFISSISTEIGTSGYAPYIISKSAIEGLIRNIAVDFSDKNITANTLRLGPFKTSRTKAFWKRDFYQDHMRKLILQNKMGEPSMVNSFINSLIAKDSFVNGQSINISGGLPLIDFKRFK